MQKLFVLFLLLATSHAFAEVTLFQAERRPVRINGDLRLSSSALSGTNLNRGTAGQEVVRFVDRVKDRFGLTKVDGEVLPLRNRHAGRSGFSLRFIQRFNRVHIEGAELIANFDWDGNLKSLNSSLLPEPPITVQPELSREEAYRIAVSELGYREPEQGSGFRDGLLIVRRDRRPLLVWQFSLREHETGDNPYSVQVVAQGPHKGRINRVVSLAHSADGDVNIYDASVTVVVPNPIYKGVKVLKNHKPTLAGRVMVSTEARSASQNLFRTRDFFSLFYDRRSWDNNGADINASVNVQKFGFLDVLGLKQNAAWLGPWKMFIFGAGGDMLGDFASALDVVGHEYTHAVISSTSNLEYVSQSGALNEHLADVMGILINQHYNQPQNPYLLGATVLRGDLRRRAEALRDMRHPEKGLRPQPAHVDEISDEYKHCRPSPRNDNCGVHILSGVPNKAAALMLERLGFERVRELFYQVMTAKLRSSSNFEDYRNQMIEECHASMTSRDCEVVKAAFAEVGL